MNDQGKLMAIKVLHTVIGVLLSAVVFYLLYAVLVDRIGRWFWYGLGLIGVEVAVLLFFRLSCPLTVVARRYSDPAKANFDIFLPEWLARHNKTIYSLIMAFVLCGLA
jgi:Na+/melibiose symporter-like transporter